MNPGRLPWVVILAVLLAAPAALGQDQPASPTAAEARWIDGWPKAILSAGILYAPAPLFGYRKDGRWSEIKLLDQFGPMLSLEWRLADYLLAGGFLDVLANQGALLTEGGVRFGGMVPFGPRGSWYGLARLGFSDWSTKQGDRLTGGTKEKQYFGWQLGLTLGLRYLFSPKYGVFAELSATAVGYTAMSGTAYEGIEQDNNPYLFRLLILLGVMFGRL